jgi:hypothetical protein
MPRFFLVESSEAKRRAQRKLKAAFLEAMAAQGKHVIGFNGGNMTVPLYSNGDGQIWYASFEISDSAINRYWNGFGLFAPSKPAQIITVELNIPTETNGQQVAGFLARDADTDRVYLMHSGKVGGGRPGIGKSAFLAWSKLPRVPVIDSTGSERFGIVIGSIEQSVIPATVDRFVRLVADFKARAASGELDDPEFRCQVEEFDRFNPEFAGRKTGRAAGPIDYVSAHGYVVNALYKKRLEEKQPGEIIFNTPLIDLVVKHGNRIVEIYEVKTDTDRQAMYAAVGQLMVHSGEAEAARKILVLPAGQELPSDIIAALSSLEIDVHRFALEKGMAVSFPASSGCGKRTT